MKSVESPSRPSVVGGIFASALTGNEERHAAGSSHLRPWAHAFGRYYVLLIFVLLGRQTFPNPYGPCLCIFQTRTTYRGQTTREPRDSSFLSLSPCLPPTLFPSPPVSATLFSTVVATCKNKNKKRRRRGERTGTERERERQKEKGTKRERKSSEGTRASLAASLSSAISFPPRVSKTTLERAACTESE